MTQDKVDATLENLRVKDYDVSVCDQLEKEIQKLNREIEKLETKRRKLSHNEDQRMDVMTSIHELQ